jgi:hypothetical protein
MHFMAICYMYTSEISSLHFPMLCITRRVGLVVSVHSPKPILSTIECMPTNGIYTMSLYPLASLTWYTGRCPHSNLWHQHYFPRCHVSGHLNESGCDADAAGGSIGIPTPANKLTTANTRLSIPLVFFPSPCP